MPSYLRGNCSTYSFAVPNLRHSASSQKGTGEKIDGYLAVVLGSRSKPGEIGSALVFASAVEAAEADHQVAQGGEILGSVSSAGGRAILAEGDVADIVDGILDGPVTTAEGLDLSGIHFGGGAAGEKDFGFLGNAKGLEMVSGATDHGGLDGVGKS